MVGAKSPGAVETIRWQSGAMVQLATGYQPLEVLNVVQGTSISEEAMCLLNALFQSQWRFSRNESWTYNA